MEKSNPSKLKIVLIAWVGFTLAAVLGILFGLAYQLITDQWVMSRFIRELSDSMFSFLVGWVYWMISFKHWLSLCPWLTISFFIWSLYINKIKPLYWCFLFTFIFALFWPNLMLYTFSR